MVHLFQNRCGHSEQGQSGSAFLSLHSSRVTKEISRHNDFSSGQRFSIKPDPGISVLYCMVPRTASELQEVPNEVAFIVYTVRFSHHVGYNSRGSHGVLSFSLPTQHAFFFSFFLLTKISLIEVSSPRDDRENPLFKAVLISQIIPFTLPGSGLEEDT